MKNYCTFKVLQTSESLKSKKICFVFFFKLKSFTEQWKDVVCRISEQYKQIISVLFLDNDLFC